MISFFFFLPWPSSFHAWTTTLAGVRESTNSTRSAFTKALVAICSCSRRPTRRLALDASRTSHSRGHGSWFWTWYICFSHSLSHANPRGPTHLPATNTLVTSGSPHKRCSGSRGKEFSSHTTVSSASSFVAGSFIRGVTHTPGHLVSKQRTYT